MFLFKRFNQTALGNYRNNNSLIISNNNIIYGGSNNPEPNNNWKKKNDYPQLKKSEYILYIYIYIF